MQCSCIYSHIIKTIASSIIGEIALEELHLLAETL